MEASNRSPLALKQAYKHAAERVWGMCECADPERVYFENEEGHKHGWMCARCKKLIEEERPLPPLRWTAKDVRRAAPPGDVSFSLYHGGGLCAEGVVFETGYSERRGLYVVTSSGFKGLIGEGYISFKPWKAGPVPNHHFSTPK